MRFLGAVLVATVIHFFVLDWRSRGAIPWGAGNSAPVFLEPAVVSGEAGGRAPHTQRRVSSGGTGVLDSSAVFKLGNHPPEYPDLAARSGWEGTVVLQLLIGGDGTVSNVRVASGSGYRILDDSALDAARGWRIDSVRGQEVTVPIRFQLE